MIKKRYYLYYKYALLPKLIKMREDGELTELKVIEEHLSARSHVTFEDKISIFKKNPITEEGCAKTQFNYPDIYVALVL